MMSIKTEILKGTDVRNNVVRLIHKTAGNEIAGSALRYTDDLYGCITTLKDGTTTGQWFKSFDSAETMFLSKSI